MKFDLPSEYYKQLGNFECVNEVQQEKVKAFMLQRWPVLQGKKIQLKIAFREADMVYNVVLLGRDCPLSKCCKMTLHFQFTKDIGGKVICMEGLCALNPLDHFFVDMDVVKCLFYDYPLGAKTTEESHYYHLGNHVLSKQQFRKMKPQFKKVVSSEISKIVSKGTHINTGIRKLIEAQDIEQKAHDQGGANLRHLRAQTFIPRRLTRSNMISLLYDGSSQEQALSSQASEFEEAMAMY